MATACAVSVPDNFEKLALNQGLDAWLQAVFACNAYVDEQAPWALRKTDPERMATVLFVLCNAIRSLAIAIAPVIPNGSSRILDYLGVAAEARNYQNIKVGELQNSFRIEQPSPVFPRLEVSEKPVA